MVFLISYKIQAMNRRNFIRNTALSAAMLAVIQKSGFAFLQDPGFKFVPLRKDVGVFIGQGGTIAWLVNKNGIVVVDSQFPDPAKQAIDGLKKMSDQPFSYLINTHHHGDHTGGNIAFKGVAQHVVAHANSKANQEKAAQAAKNEDKQLYPDMTYTDTWKTKVGGETIQMHYFGAGHTNGDSVVHFQNANIAHMGDLMFNKRYPFIDRANGANIASWIQVLDKTIKKFDNDTLFVFGHALDPEKVTGGKDELRAMQNYLDKLLVFVQAEIKAGKSKEDIMKATAIPGASDYSGQGVQRSLTAAYDELTAGK